MSKWFHVFKLIYASLLLMSFDGFVAYIISVSSFLLLWIIPFFKNPQSDIHILLLKCQIGHFSVRDLSVEKSNLEMWQCLEKKKLPNFAFQFIWTYLNIKKSLVDMGNRQSFCDFCVFRNDYLPSFFHPGEFSLSYRIILFKTINKGWKDVHPNVCLLLVYMLWRKSFFVTFLRMWEI